MGGVFAGYGTLYWWLTLLHSSVFFVMGFITTHLILRNLVPIYFKRSHARDVAWLRERCVADVLEALQQGPATMPEVIKRLGGRTRSYWHCAWAKAVLSVMCENDLIEHRVVSADEPCKDVFALPPGGRYDGRVVPGTKRLSVSVEEMN